MSRLEEKLKELGYEKVYYCNYDKPMSFDGEVKICVSLDKFNEKVKESIVAGYRFITKQGQLNTMQNAFEQMQKDLEVLKEYEII